MSTARIPLNELERRKVVKVARGKRTTVPKLLKGFALGQIEADTQPSKPVSEVEKWETFMEGLNGFTDDFMPPDRDVETSTKRGIS